MWGEQEGNPSTLKIIRYTIFSSYFGKTLSLFFTKIYILFRIPLNKGKTAASGRLEAASGKIVFLQFCNVFQIITLLLISY